MDRVSTIGVWTHYPIAKMDDSSKPSIKLKGPVGNLGAFGPSSIPAPVQKHCVGAAAVAAECCCLLLLLLTTTTTATTTTVIVLMISGVVILRSPLPPAKAAAAAAAAAGVGAGGGRKIKCLIQEPPKISGGPVGTTRSGICPTHPPGHPYQNLHLPFSR